MGGVRVCLLVSVLAVGGSAGSLAEEWYVDAASVGGTPTGAADNPFPTVQAAIDAAAAGDEIRVAAGTYTANLRIVAKGITLRGGYGAGWTRDIAANPTTLAGAGGDAVINVIESDATIDGFRITGGTGSIEEQPYGYHGGGIYSRDGSPTITNNTIESNDIRDDQSASDYNLGGGVHITGAAYATVTHNVIRGNYAGRGGGLSITGQQALIDGNTIEDNVAIGDHGGGLYIAVAQATITNNIIRGNEVGRELGYGWGGGLIVFGAGNEAEIAFNRVYANFAAAYGSGEFVDEGATAEIHHELVFRNLSKDGCEAVSAISVDGGEGVGSRAVIWNCTVVGNVCPDATRGNGLQVEGMSDVVVVNSIFWNNGGDDFAVFDTSTLAITYSCSEETWPGAGNISADPQFVDAAGDDYHLLTGSPCIDAGDPATTPAAGQGDTGRVDLGRYAFTVGTPTPDEPDDSVSNDDPTAGDGTPASDDAPTDPAPGDEMPDDAVAPLTGSAVCPGATGLLLSLSLVGCVRRRAAHSLRRRVG